MTRKRILAWLLARRRRPLPSAQRSPVVVAAGVLLEGDRVLLTQRKAGSHLAGLWEFPGGKVEAHESIAAALRRELREELGIDVQVHEELDVTRHDYPTKTVQLHFHRVEREVDSPPPQALDVAALHWASQADLATLPMPAADVPIVAKVMALLASR